jgi:hypothetical protein
VGRGAAGLRRVALDAVPDRHAALVWFALKVTGNRFLALLPGIVWFVVSFLGAERTTEGDIILYNWVATIYIYAGAITVGVAAYRMIVVPLRS